LARIFTASCLLALVSFGNHATLKAQTVASYNFTQSAGTYTAITGGTSYTAGADDAVYGGTANLIPFTFVYRGNNYTSFRISTNGFITLGNAITPANANYTPISNSAASSVYAIAALGCDLYSAVRYEVLGSTPNRVAVIQWSNAYRYSPGPGSTESLNFQIRLYETSNNIEVVYGTQTAVASTASVGQVGLKGAANTDFNNVSFTSATLTGYPYSRSWDNLISGSLNTSAVIIGTGLSPASGTTLLWTPSTCAQPVVSATATAIGTTGFTANWTNSGTYASGYYVRWRKVEEDPTTSTWITPTLVAAGSSSYAVPGLAHSTYYIYSVEGRCGVSSVSNISRTSNGNLTNTTGLVRTALACPGTPSALNSSAVTATTATISWTAASPAPGNGYHYYVSTSATAPTGATTPTGSTAAGVVTANLTSLTANTTYYYWVRSNCGGSDVSTWVGSGTFYTGHCIASSSSQASWISVFNTTGGVSNISHTAGSGAAGGYADLTASNTVSNYLGNATNLAMTAGGPTCGFAIWVDWNNDLVFAAGEKMFNTTGYVTSTTGSFNIPGGTPNGNYRMRVKTDFNASNPASACGNITRGEYKDFTFEVVSAPSCAQLPSALGSSAVTAASATISWTAASPAPANGYHFYVSTSATAPTGGTTPTGSTGAGVVTANLTVLSPNTNYYFWVRSNCNGTDFSGWVGSGTFYTGYCSASSTSQASWISAFSTTGGLSNITHTAGAGAAGGYADLSTSNTVSNYIGNATNVAMTAGGPTCGFAIWVDWNNDLVFDAGERMFNTTGYVTNTTGSFNIPGGTPNGNYRMRVKTDYNALNPATACGNITRGEYKDFTFAVVSLSNCSGLPTAGTPPADATVCPNTATTLTVTGADFGTGISYQWEEWNGSVWVNAAGGSNATTTAYTTPAITVAKEYRLTTTCSFSGQSASTAGIDVTPGLLASCYCPVSITNNDPTGLTNVTFNTINNTTVGNPAVSDFSAISTTVAQGSAYTLSCQVNTDGPYTVNVKAWIDWNQNGVFDVPSEEYDLGNAVNTANGITSLTPSVVVPGGAALGTTFMRVGAIESSNPAPTACGNPLLYGEYELYTIVVIAGTNCSGTPTAGTPPAGSTICSGATRLLTATGVETGTGISYQWEEWNGSSWVNALGGSGATTISYTTPALTATTQYRFTTTCSFSGFSASSAAVTVTVNLTPACYCPVSITYSDPTGITAVNFNTINNTSNGNPAVTDFTAISTTVERGVPYQLSVKVNTDGNYTVNAKAWIDWNQNSVFDIAEEYNLGSALNTSNGITSITPSVTVPLTAVLGTTYMRVAGIESSNATPLVCGNPMFYGEYEMYTIVVNPEPSCLPPTPTATTSITPNSATLNWTASVSAPSGGYQWEVRTSGAGGSGATGLVASGSVGAGVITANVGGLSANSSYQVYVRSNCGSGDFSAWANTAFANTTGDCISGGCLGGTLFPTGLQTTTSPTFVTVSTTIWQGDYAIYEVINGATYEWSLCAADGGSAPYDSELTLMTGDGSTVFCYSDDYCGDDAKISWTSTFNGTVRVLVTEYDNIWGSACTYGWDDNTTLRWRRSAIPYWTGLVSTSWTNVGNWNSSLVPLSTHDVLIPTAPLGNRFPDIAVAAAVNSITIESGANINIQSGHSLTTTGVITNNGTISVANGGSLVQFTASTITGGGTYSIARNGSAVYDFWSSPITSASTSLLSGTVYQYNPNSGTADPSDDAFDPGWVAPAATMAVSKGYAAYGAGSKIFNGTVNNGPLPIGVTAHGAPNVSFNLIGNPYPSGIDVSSFLAANSGLLTVGSVFLWDDPGTNTYVSADYAVRNGLSGVAGGGGTTPTGIIGTAQGFKVEVNGNGNIQFTNAMRSTGNTANLFRAMDTKLAWISATSTENRFNQMLVGFVEDGTDGSDWAYDAPKLNSLGELSLYSYMDGQPLAIQGYGPLEQERVVPLGLNSQFQTTVKIGLDSTSNMNDYAIILEDRYFNIYHDLKQSAYLFQSSPMLYDDRFFLRFGPEVITGIQEESSAVTMNAFIANDLLQLRTSKPLKGILELTDMSGKTIWKADDQKIDQNGFNFDVFSLSRGSYVVHLWTKDGSFVQKVFK